MTRTESSIRQIDIIANTYSARKSGRSKQFDVQEIISSLTSDRYTTWNEMGEITRYTDNDTDLC